MEKMENDSTESHTISRDVPRMGLDNENLDYVENSRINLRGVLHMNSGNDAASYAENSQRQGYVLHALQPLLKVAIERLRFLHEGPLRIADMGCATGINTVSGVDFVVKTLVNMWGNGHSNGGGSVTEYQAYFVDLPSNDFNGLFNLLDRPASPYFVAGVPGSFYNVLFPRSSIHVCFSVLSLHWLSQVPEAVVQKSSPLYNKGRVWINRGRQDIAEAYSKQSQKDLNAFFSCRAREMAPGGVLFLCTMGRPDTWPPQEQLSVREEFCGQDFEDAWDELVTQGIVSSVLRDSFNMPWYFVSPEELRQAADNCGAFEMESIQVCEGIPCMSSEELEQYIRDPKTFGLMKSTFVKSYMGALIEAHIGKECADKLFELFAEKATALLHCNPPSGLATCTVSSLIRK